MAPAGRSGAVLVAAGSGERSATGAGSIPKQFRPLGGRPLVTWSFDALAGAGCSPIVITTPPGELPDEVRALGDGAAILVEGGATRQESVRRGLARIDEGTVVVHDAVRPFPGRGIVTAVLDALERADGAISAVPLDETLKMGEDDRIVSTVDRSNLWRAQTPQAFRTEILKRAHSEAAAAGFEGTDDAGLVERIGGTVVLVAGSRDNLKITYPEDFELAEAIAARETR